MAALISSLAISGARDSSGNPLSGGRVFLTRPGTQVAVTGYQNRDATASHTLNQGGIILDAGGRAEIYTTEPADVRVEDSTGVTIDTFSDPQSTAGLVEVRNAGFTGTDPVSGQQVAGGRTYLDTVLSSLAASTGGVDGLVRTSTSAVARSINAKFSEVQVSVKDFGAVGNGIADDTPWIQAAINYVSSQGGGVVYAPPGTYLTSVVISLPTGVSFIGAGATATLIKPSSTTQNAVAIATGATGRSSIERMGFTHSTATTGAAISITSGTLYLVAVNVDSGGSNTRFRTAISKSGTSTISIAGCDLRSAVTSDASAIGIDDSSSGGTTSLIDSRTTGRVAGIRVVAGALSMVASSAIGTGTGIGLQITGGAYVQTASGLLSGSTVAVDVADAGATLLIDKSTQITGTITDARTGAPVNYNFAGANNMTPLPLQADVIRVAQATGAVVTTINNITAIGFRPFVLICSNTSAGASTFTFGASYVLSAAVTPGAGTRVALNLYYDPISGKTFESGRAATAN